MVPLFHNGSVSNETAAKMAGAASANLRMRSGCRGGMAKNPLKNCGPAAPAVAGAGIYPVWNQRSMISLPNSKPISLKNLSSPRVGNDLLGR